MAERVELCDISTLDSFTNRGHAAVTGGNALVNGVWHNAAKRVPGRWRSGGRLLLSAHVLSAIITCSVFIQTQTSVHSDLCHGGDQERQRSCTDSDLLDPPVVHLLPIRQCTGLRNLRPYYTHYQSRAVPAVSSHHALGPNAADEGEASSVPSGGTAASGMRHAKKLAPLAPNQMPSAPSSTPRLLLHRGHLS
uniref:Uncharacterized protein n=1 Tax=Knipowitschia caucasica TaxID=637954 RepID=A0AAV2LFU7_KNICA